MNNVKVSIITSVYRCEKYLESFLQHLARINHAQECELVLVHNDATAQELSILSSFKGLDVNIVHIRVAREALYSSWNRAITVASGEYLTIWNVDDVRLPNSIKDQADALDNNPEAAVAYGDYGIVNEYGSVSGEIVFAPDFNNNDTAFLRHHHIGPFPMWRKCVHQKIGYFDEQFKLVADLDFQIRAAKVFQFTKVDKLLGFYLEGTESNLSSNYQLQDLEKTVLHLRYGNFDLIYLTYLFSVGHPYKLHKYTWFHEYHTVSHWTSLKPYWFLINLPRIAVSFYRLPRHLARRYLRPIARKHLKYHTYSFFSKGDSRQLT